MQSPLLLIQVCFEYLSKVHKNILGDHLEMKIEPACVELSFYYFIHDGKLKVQSFYLFKIILVDCGRFQPGYLKCQGEKNF